MSPNDCGRARGVVKRLDLSMVATSPRSMMSGASVVLRVKVFVVNEWSFFAIVEVLRKPNPFRRSVSVDCSQN